MIFSARPFVYTLISKKTIEKCSSTLQRYNLLQVLLLCNILYCFVFHFTHLMNVYSCPMTGSSLFTLNMKVRVSFVYYFSLYSSMKLLSAANLIDCAAKLFYDFLRAVLYSQSSSEGTVFARITAWPV